ncbi:MAG: cyanophycinase [Bacteroidota bacterium]|nr:cyanophycinase [Bacteroidota bacterium]
MQYPKGYLVSIGGAEDKGDTSQKEKSDEKENTLDFLRNGILKKVVDLLKSNKPEIEIITTATGSPEESYNNYKKAFTELGCISVGHLDIRDREAANDKKLIERVESCSGVMFSGGDQARLTSILGGTSLCQILKERYKNEQFVIAGTSAGAAAMSATMMNGGSTQDAYLKGEIKLTAGFGFVSDVIIDTHFDARGRFARLAQALAENPGIVAIGLSEDTGVVVEKGHLLTVVGSSVVTIIEGREIIHNNIADIKDCAPLSVGKLGVYLLSHSDQFNLLTREFKPVAFEEHVS